MQGLLEDAIVEGVTAGPGGTLDGQYVYFATDTYPFFPRCFRGTVSSDFIGGLGERPPRDDAGPTPAP